MVHQAHVVCIAVSYSCSQNTIAQYIRLYVDVHLDHQLPVRGGVSSTISPWVFGLVPQLRRDTRYLGPGHVAHVRDQPSCPGSATPSTIFVTHIGSNWQRPGSCWAEPMIAVESDLLNPCRGVGLRPNIQMIACVVYNAAVFNSTTIHLSCSPLIIF